jgi:hypothetical protein
MRKKISGLNQRARLYLLFLSGVIALFSSTAYTTEKILPKPIFKLTQGQGTEVCEAYLQRLNATEFLDNDPVKGRVSEPLLKGFADLKPVPLTAEEIQRLYYKIISFNRFRDQSLLEKYMETHKHDKEDAWRIIKAKKLPEEIKNYMIEDQKTPFVRYQEKLDLDNDGTATNTVIKNNYGTYIVNSDLQKVDEANMMAMFADKELLEWPTITQFPPMTMSTNVFNYKGKYYFDGFLDLIFYNVSHEVDFSVPLRIGVFIYQNLSTHKICEYQWFNSPDKHLRPYYYYYQ